MAIHTFTAHPTAPIASGDSDYGSDIDDATADDLISRAKSRSPVKAVAAVADSILPSIEEASIAELEEDVFTHNFSVRLARLQHSLDGVEASRAKLEQIVQRRRREAAVEVEYDERNRRAFSPSNPEEPTPATPESPTLARTKQKKDTRSPLQRFRSRRPLSVTNLVSPSWCEQQYEYNLSHHGRIPQTKAMTAGSTAHKELEEQVHVEVPVEVVSREDRFGLKLWNTIQGLRALRETGLTRELEVWGVVEGEVVNGIIDEVTVECPDAEMEVRVLKQLEGADGASGQGKKEAAPLPPDQRTLTDFLTGSSQGGSILEQARRAPASASSPPHLRDRPTTTYYLKDIKTTKRDRPPAHPAYTRGAHLQLMLYQRMLSTLTADQVSPQQVFSRYHLDAAATFSDKFIAELANLDMRAFVSVPDDADLPPSVSQQDPLTELLEHNTLAMLWGLLIRELQTTFPAAARPPPNTSSLSSPPLTSPSYPSISPLLTVEYRNPLTSSVIGTRSFPLDPRFIADYLKSEISWWRGERPTVGVSVEDAWKCGWCEFAAGCEWRREKVEEGVERARLRREGTGGRSGV